MWCNKRYATFLFLYFNAFPASSFIMHCTDPVSRLRTSGLSRSGAVRGPLPFHRQTRDFQRTRISCAVWDGYPDSSKKNSGEYGVYRESALMHVLLRICFPWKMHLFFSLRSLGKSGGIHTVAQHARFMILTECLPHAAMWALAGSWKLQVRVCVCMQRAQPCCDSWSYVCMCASRLHPVYMRILKVALHMMMMTMMMMIACARSGRKKELPSPSCWR
jgi:hypothetical protein